MVLRAHFPRAVPVEVEAAAGARLLPLPARPPPPWPSLVTCPSYSMPAGLVPNTNPFWTSRKVSKIIRKLSVLSSERSRRESETMIRAGSRS